jgi:hypothetical protein
MAIANIERIDIITEESAPRVFSFDTASESSAEAQISAGAENELRIKNQILAQNITEDIVKGFNITFTDTTFSPEVFALVDGGQSTVDSEENFRKYSSPTAGEVVARIKCRLAVYAAEKDYDGNTLSYTAFVFPHASGSPASVKLKDGEFFAPSYTMKSRPSKGQSPMTVLSLPSLPVIVKSNNDLPSQPEIGKTVVLSAGSVSQLDSVVQAGHFAIYTQENTEGSSEFGGAITVGYYQID